MKIWLAPTVAVGMWGTVAFLFGRQFRRNARQTKQRRVTVEVERFFGSPEDIVKKVQSNPNDPIPAIKWAQIAATEKNWPELFIRSQKVSLKFPNLPHGHMLLARSLWMMDDRVQASSIMYKLFRLFPNDTEVMEVLIFQMKEQKKWHEMAHVSGAFRKRYPMALRGYSWQFDAFLQLKDFKKAKRILNKAEQVIIENQDLAPLWKKELDSMYSKIDTAYSEIVQSKNGEDP